MSTPEQHERLGRLADRLDAILYGTKLPLPPHIHIECMSGTVREVRDEIANLYVELTGVNPWEDNPLEG